VSNDNGAEESYGEMIARLRDEKGWTQDDLVEATGGEVSKRALQAIEAGETQSPQRRTRQVLAQALDIEGDAEKTRGALPIDVRAFLNAIGVALSHVDEAEREEVMRANAEDLFARLFRHGRTGNRFHPNDR